MSKLKIAAIIFGIFLIGSAAWVFYFTNHVNAVISPVKDYDFSTAKGKPEQPVINVIKADSLLAYKVTKIIDNKDGRRYYMDITLKSKNESCLYNVCIETKTAFLSNDKHTTLHLIGAFNPLEETGGYKMENNGVQGLVSEFEKAVINKLPKD